MDGSARNIRGVSKVGSKELGSKAHRPFKYIQSFTFELQGEQAAVEPQAPGLAPELRRQRARELAERYVQLMGVDAGSSAAAAAKTAEFYGRTDALLKRLENLVS